METILDLKSVTVILRDIKFYILSRSELLDWVSNGSDKFMFSLHPLFLLFLFGITEIVYFEPNRLFCKVASKLS
jgi:hypothetical protein